MVLHAHVLASFSRKVAINRRDFSILELLSTDFIYIGKIIDNRRKNAITSERDVTAGETRGMRENERRNLSSRNCSAV